MVRNQAEEFVAVSTNGERVGDIEGDGSIGLFGNFQRQLDRSLLRLRIPHVSGEMKKISLTDGFDDHVGTSKIPVRSQIGVHRPLGIG